MGFTVYSLFIPYYGFFIVLGLAVASLIGLFQIRLFKKNFNDFLILASMAGLGGIVGAKLLYLAVSWRDIDFSKIGDPSYIGSLLGGGFVFYGGLIGGALGLFLCRKWLTGGITPYVEVCVPCLPAAHGFGRLGCYAVGCCYGVPSHSPLAVVYHASPVAPNGVALFPVQLMEAVGNFVIAAVLLLYIDLSKQKNGPYLYILLYAPMRFTLEFFRYDAARGYVGALSVSQWISLLLTALAAVLFIKRAAGKIETEVF